MKRWSWVFVGSVSLVFASASVALGQAATPENASRATSPGPFNFGPPGARSLGMGSSFIGIADDATASESNPAGLVILTKPEVSVHGRAASPEVLSEDLTAVFAVEFAQINRADSGLPPLAVEPETQSTFDEGQTSASFASFVYPFERFVFALYYLESLNFEGRDSFQFADRGIDQNFFEERYATRNELDSRLSHLGASGAFKIGKHVSLGGSVRRSTFDVDSRAAFDFDLIDVQGVLGAVAGASVISLDQANTTSDDDEDWTYNVGLLINPSGTVSVGFVYKEGGKFDLRGAFASDLVVQGVAETPVRESSIVRQEIPDTLGGGVAWRPTDRLTFAADVLEISYSDLDFSRQELTPGQAAVVERIDDEIEFHFGVEYQLLPGQGLNPISLRGGFWTDPDHDGFATIDSDQEHYTVGVGFVVKQDFQIDLAGHFSDTVDEGLLSLVYRF